MSAIHECFDNDLDPAWNKDMNCEIRIENANMEMDIY